MQILQVVITALLVAASAGFAAWRLSPARLRLRLLDALKPDATTLWGRWLVHLRQGVVANLTHGCGGCARAPTHTRHRTATRRS